MLWVDVFLVRVGEWVDLDGMLLFAFFSTYSALQEKYQNCTVRMWKRTYCNLRSSFEYIYSCEREV